MSRLLVITAVDAEADAVCAGLMGTWRPAPPKRSAAPPRAGARLMPSHDRQLLTAVRLGPYLARRSGAVTVLATGVGGPAAAAGTAACLAAAPSVAEPFDLVIAVGVGGGFPGQAGVGDIVVADRVVAADLGAEVAPPPTEEADGSGAASAGDRPAGFLDLTELGLGTSVLTPHPGVVTQLAQAMDGIGRAVRVGAVVSVSTVTGTDSRAGVLAARHDPVAEGMEGYGAAVAATAFGVPFAEIRAISNPVGRRDRAGWDLPAALSGLSAVSVLLTEFAETVDLSGIGPSAQEWTRPRSGPTGKGAPSR